jgi:hypothetical protein
MGTVIKYIKYKVADYTQIIFRNYKMLIDMAVRKWEFVGI